MAMLVIDGLTVNVALNGGLASRVEDLTDRARSIAGTLLITQLSGTVAASKDNLSCTTVPLTTTDLDTLLTKLRSAAILPVTGDIGARDVSAIITAITPMTVAGLERRWVVSFELIQD